MKSITMLWLIVMMLQSYTILDKKEIFILDNLTYCNAVSYKYNIPDGVVLAIAAHESGWGTSKAYANNCNPLGLRNNKDKAITFKSKAHCYEYFGKMITTKQRYNEMLCPMNYRSYIVTLAECGYNTEDPQWAGKVIAIYLQLNKNL